MEKFQLQKNTIQVLYTHTHINTYIQKYIYSKWLMVISPWRDGEINFYFLSYTFLYLNLKIKYTLF